MVMKQIGFNRRRALWSKPTKELEVLDETPGAHRGPSVEDAVGGTLRVQGIEKALEVVFADDVIGWAIFEARLVEQMPVEEACSFAGIPRDQYETVLKRVTRKLAKAVESGAIR
jgi:DNA-directed RNA polymerase specialized sigma24 family protein